LSYKPAEPRRTIHRP